MTEQEYTYAEHRFRFATWAATRAMKKLSAPPPKKQGKLTGILTDILREVLFDKITGKDDWQLEDEILGDDWILRIEYSDSKHASWRKRICELAKEKEITHTDLKGEAMSHGQAAKLINVFIKALMPLDMDTVSDELRTFWCTVHPPIDSIMLGNMDKCIQCNPPKTDKCECEFGCRFVEHAKKWKSYTWTQLGPCDYENLIRNIKEHEPCLWKIENFWKP